uniref:Uncharacterized protein n=1 Tax=Oryza barthii TaxID=65489 RepID=A0A0D3FKE0_9ORYZ
MSVLVGCRILQRYSLPRSMFTEDKVTLLKPVFPHFDNACLDKQHHERFHSPGITSSFDMFCSLSPVLLSFLHFFHAHGFRSDQNHGCMIRSIDSVVFTMQSAPPSLLPSEFSFDSKLGKGTGGYIAYS